ncbi:MAG: ATP-binding protein, partial [Candidatus Omnitrophica bacterium]|nr:ATP-binding protein [Candidatus Omnitrophota bacterium]
GGLLQTWSGELALDATSEISAGMWNIHPLFSGDRQAIIGALTSSDTVVTDEELAAGGFFLTCYSPIVFNNRCRGLVGVRANILFADRLAKMRRGLILAAAIGSILISLLTAMFYAVLGRLDRMQARMEQRERLAQLGQMVSIVAHEIRNPLGIIEQTSDLIRRKYSKDEPDLLLGYISEEVDRLNRLVNRFLDFARPSSDQAAEARGERSCDLAREIEEIHGLLLPQADSKSIEFAIEVEEGLSQVRNIDREGMKQILLNLILNAFDATPPGGSVRVVARSETGGVILRVIDEGDGMTPEQLKKATDPFYTTKEKGSGLGLALVAKMVEEAGATLEIGSSPGEGSCFTISFDN